MTNQKLKKLKKLKKLETHVVFPIKKPYPHTSFNPSSTMRAHDPTYTHCWWGIGLCVLNAVCSALSVPPS